MFDKRKNIRENLAWVIFVGQTVDDWHARVRGKFFDDGLLKGADHHRVDHACDDARNIFNRLATRELGVARRQIDHRAPHLQHTGFE